MFFHNILPVLITVHWVREQPLICHLLSSHGCPDADGTSTASPCRSAPRVQVGGTQWQLRRNWWVFFFTCKRHGMSHLQKGEQVMNEWINGNQNLLVSSTIPLIPFSWDLGGILNRDSFHSGRWSAWDSQSTGVPPVAGRSSQGVKLMDRNGGVP